MYPFSALGFTPPRGPPFWLRSAEPKALGGQAGTPSGMPGAQPCAPRAPRRPPPRQRPQRSGLPTQGPRAPSRVRNPEPTLTAKFRGCFGSPFFVRSQTITKKENCCCSSFQPNFLRRGPLGAVRSRGGWDRRACWTAQRPRAPSRARVPAGAQGGCPGGAARPRGAPRPPPPAGPGGAYLTAVASDSAGSPRG